MIRRAEPRDAADLQTICEAALGHAAPVSLLERRIRELTADSGCFLAVYEDEETQRALGFLHAQTYRLLYGGSGWNVIALAVAPEAQRQGIGRKLLSALERDAVRRGDAFVRLNCNVTREGAHAFYRQMGYACDKVQKRFIRSLREEVESRCPGRPG